MQALRKFYFQREKFCLFAVTALYLIFSAIYPLFNHPLKYTFYFGTFIDELIPFSPFWIIFYIVWFCYIPGLGLTLLIKGRKTYLKWIVALNLGIVTCFLIYSFFQTTVPRPEVTGSDFFANMVRRIYANDQPYNCFPSIHVMTTFICMIFIKKLRGLRRPVAWALLLTGWLINFSTMFVKQHVFLDMVSGIVVAVLAYRAAEYFVDRLYNSAPLKTQM